MNRASGQPATCIVKVALSCLLAVLMAMLVLLSPLIAVAWCFNELMAWLTGHTQWVREQQRKMTEERPPLAEADFLAVFGMAESSGSACLALRESLAWHCGVPATAIYPDDDYKNIVTIMGPGPGMGGILIRVERTLAVEIPVSVVYDRLREHNQHGGAIETVRDFIGVVAPAICDTLPEGASS